MQILKAAVVEQAQPAVSEDVQKKIIDLPSCKDNENLLRIRHSVSFSFSVLQLNLTAEKDQVCSLASGLHAVPLNL